MYHITKHLRLLNPVLNVLLSPDRRADGAEDAEAETSPSPAGSHSPVMDRNPSPPPDTADGEEDGDLDAIGDTVYSKHWLFNTLTRLINVSCYCLSQHEILSLHKQFKWTLEVTVLRVNEQNEKLINLIADGHRALGDGL